MAQIDGVFWGGRAACTQVARAGGWGLREESGRESKGKGVTWHWRHPAVLPYTPEERVFMFQGKKREREARRRARMGC